MSEISNLYATKIFAEHPLALWPLDDNNYFINTLKNSSDVITNWTILEDNGEWETDLVPFPERNSAVLTKTSAASVTFTQINASPIYSTHLDPSKDTISISTWVEEYGSLVTSYEIGFQYNSGSSSIIDSEIFKSIGANNSQQISKTSNIKEEFDYITPFVKINYIEEFAVPIEYKVLFTAISVGQWSEEYTNNFNLGIRDSEIIEIDNVAIIASLPYLEKYNSFLLDAYGFQDSDNAYAIIDNNKLLCRNIKFPMIYGSENSTLIESPITTKMPSLIIPGKGFLNKNGRYSNITLEFWLRINPKVNINKRIVGPIRSEDGIYINNEYIEIRVGTYVKSYFIGKWYRPMLIDFSYSPTNITLSINGDRVIDIDIDLLKLNFPTSPFDWICFYGSDDFYSYEIDCVAIYPYITPEQALKRRFIYGQAIENRELITDNFKGDSYNIDFHFSNYSKVVEYPDTNSWNLGIFNNMNATNRYLTFSNNLNPELFISGDPIIDEFPDTYAWSQYSDFEDVWYDLAADKTWETTLSIQDTSFSNIYEDNLKIQSGSSAFFKIRPNYSYSDINGSIEFSSINPLSDKTTSVHAVIRIPESLSTNSQTIMYFSNFTNNNFFKIELKESSINYIYNDILIKSNTISENELITCGFDLNEIDRSYENILNNFFATPELTSLSFMGRDSDTFLGEFYQISFNNDFYTKKDLFGLFDSDGIAFDNRGNELKDYVGAYTYKPIVLSNSLFLDVCKSGYWEDSIPLSYFGKQILGKNGISYYDVDQIQFNIESPSLPTLSNNELQINSYDSIKIYATLQSIDEVGFIPYSRYDNTETILNNRVLDFDNTLDVLTTKFEIVDGTTIFPPKELIDFKDYYLTIHIETKIVGLSKKDFKLKKMMLSSIVTDENVFTKINTRSGNEIYPITRYDKSYSLKDKNPFSIYIESTPSLYLTGDSGIGILPYSKSVQSGAERAFYIPINKNRREQYSLGAVQFWGMYNYESIITKSKKIARIFTPNKKYEVFLDPIDNGKRGIIKTYDLDTGLISSFNNEAINDIVYYQDGNAIKNPIINPLRWTSIIISFGDNIEVDRTTGSIEFYEGFLYDNISVYEKSQLFTNFTIGSRIWQEVRVSELTTENEIVFSENSWNTWDSLTWEEVFSSIEPFRFTVDGSNIHKSYVGTSGTVVGDNSSIIFEEDSFNVFSDIVWNTSFVKPV